MHFAAVILVVCAGLSISAIAWADQKAPVEREVTFAGADGVQLAGTLAMPQETGHRKLPAVVMIAGSGPTDRNGNQGDVLKIDILSQFAQALAADGIASLRYDKRGVAGSMKLDGGKIAALFETKDTDALADYFRWENFVDDAKGAYRFLQEQPGIDPARVGFLGHSEGSWLALQAADELHDTPQAPRFLILVSTSGLQVDQIIHDQLVRALKAQGATEEQTKYFLDESSRITDAIRSTGVAPPDVPAGLAALYPFYIGKFFQSELEMDPSKLAAAYPGPVLVLQGEKDTQEPPNAALPPMEAALRSRHPDDHEVVIINGASHNMKIVQGDADPGFDGPVSPQAIDALGRWAAAHITESAK